MTIRPMCWPHFLNSILQKASPVSFATTQKENITGKTEHAVKAPTCRQLLSCASDYSLVEPPEEDIEKLVIFFNLTKGKTLISDDRMWSHPQHTSK